ncbi:hypothetical protein [Labrys okinawensis]|uniref:hypothetical protein n=1 Tax=Labrys okinawensis TaxID=346911 RepID=UPI0011B1DA45|nr:hypothetical protein [Labrys okinawensis]
MKLEYVCKKIAVVGSLLGGLLSQNGVLLADTLPPDTTVPAPQYSSPLFATPQDFRTLGIGSAPLPASQNQINVDEGTLRGWGYMGDGFHHRLFEITNFNGMNSTGWTLAQWKTNAGLVANSLDDEIDGVAVNSIIQKYRTTFAGNDLYIRFPKGRAYFSSPIKSCGISIVFQGSGQDQTNLIFGADSSWKNNAGTGPLLDSSGNPIQDKFVDGVNICSTSTIGNVPDEDRIELRDLTAAQAKVGGNNYGFYGVFKPSKNLYTHNIKINNFNNCMYIVNAGGSQIENTSCYSGINYFDGNSEPIGTTDPTVGDGITMIGRGAFVNHITNTIVQNYKTGYTFYASGAAGAVGPFEDVSILNSAAGNAKQCIKIYSSKADYSPLEYNIDNFSCNATSGFVDAQSVGLLTIRGGDWLVAKPFTDANATWKGQNQDFFRFCRVSNGTLEQAWLSNDGNGAAIGSYIHVFGSNNPCGTQGNANGVRTINNYLYHHNLQYNNLIVVDPTATSVTVRDNVFAGLNGAESHPPVNAFSWGPTDAASALYQGQPGEVASVAGSVASVPNGSPVTVATVNLTPGMWECSAGLIAVAGTGTSITTTQVSFNTAPNSWPLAPGYGMSQIPGSGTLRAGPHTFDLTSTQGTTPIYLIGAALYSGSAGLSGSGQCVRVR